MLFWIITGLVGQLFFLWIHYKEYGKITLGSIFGYSLIGITGPFCFIIGLFAAFGYLLCYTQFLNIVIFKKKGK